MNAILQKVETEALKLPREARAFLADRLLSSLEGEALSDVDVAWVAEAENRYAEYKSGVRQPTRGGDEMIKRFFTLEYWQDDNWFVGKIREVPGVFSHGETLAELKENIADAYRMMLDAESKPAHEGAQTLELGVEV